MKGANDIYILEANGEYRVRPAIWSSGGEQGTPKVGFRNLTNWKVIVLLPDAPVNDAKTSNIILAPGACDKRTLKSKNAGDNAERYTYSVIVITDKGAVPAAGESDPIIIIDPPPGQ